MPSHRRTTKGKAIREYKIKKKRERYIERNGTVDERVDRIDLLLSEAEESMKAAEIGEALGMSSAAAGVALTTLQRAGRVARDGRRWYSVRS